MDASLLATCLELVEEGEPARRRYRLASLAAIVVATRTLGAEWWDRPGTELERAGK